MLEPGASPVETLQCVESSFSLSIFSSTFSLQFEQIVSLQQIVSSSVAFCNSVISPHSVFAAPTIPYLSLFTFLICVSCQFLFPATIYHTIVHLNHILNDNLPLRIILKLDLENQFYLNFSSLDHLQTERILGLSSDKKIRKYTNAQIQKYKKKYTNTKLLALQLNQYLDHRPSD